MTIPVVKPRIKPRGPFTPALDPRCVCGHPLSDHSVVTASVPLLNPRPIYQVKGNLTNDANREHSTYDQQSCPCGCLQFDHGHCEFQMTVEVSNGVVVRDETVTCRLDFGHYGQHVPSAWP